MPYTQHPGLYITHHSPLITWFHVGQPDHIKPSSWKFSQAEASDEKETAQAYREAFLQVAGKPIRKTKNRHFLGVHKKTYILIFLFE